MRDYDFLQSELENRYEVLSHRMQSIKKDVSRSHSSDWNDQAQERENDEVLNQLGHDAERELREIRAALNRLKSKTYGCCLECGDAIAMSRLKIRPEATCCTACADHV